MRYAEIILLEFKVETVKVRNVLTKVWINPSHREFLRLFEIVTHPPDPIEGLFRGTLDKDYNLYLWDSLQATHDDILPILGLENARAYIYVMSPTKVATYSSIHLGQELPLDEFSHIHYGINRNRAHSLWPYA
jgi:hypothetical protein